MPNFHLHTSVDEPIYSFPFGAIFSQDEKILLCENNLEYLENLINLIPALEWAYVNHTCGLELSGTFLIVALIINPIITNPNNAEIAIPVISPIFSSFTMLNVPNVIIT